MRRIGLFILLMSFLAGGVGCSQPAGPSGSASGSGATITGAIVGGAPASGLVVSVGGTSLTATVDATSRFALQNVPSGDVQLLFSAPSVSGAIGLTGLQSAQTVDIAVAIDGSTVSLESEHREHGNEVEVEGRVEALPPTTPAASFVVAGRRVITNSSTRIMFRDGSPATFANLEIGQRVHVKGQRSGDAVTAGSVRIQNTQTDLPVELHGIVQGLTGNAAAFQFMLGDRTVKGDTLTAFADGATFSDLANNKRVEVKGQLRDGFVYARRIHIEGFDDEDEIEFEGTLTAKTGTTPNFMLTVGGRTVWTNGSTVVRRGDRVLDLSALALNQTLEVEAIRQTDGTLLARKIQIEDEEEVSVHGTITSKTGTTPNFTLVVGTTPNIRTNSATDVRRRGDRVDVSTLALGQTVEVEGVPQTDGSILARKIRIEG